MNASRAVKGAAARKPGPVLEAPASLADFILLEASRRGVKLSGAGTAPLAGLEYGLEIELKNAALRNFWRCHELPGRPEDVIASPRPRHYRTTSKRRWQAGTAPGRQWEKGLGLLNFIEEEEAAALEPVEHALIFNALGRWLTRPEFAALSRHLNFIIIRGTYAEFMVIFNLEAMDRVLHRQLLKLVSLLRTVEANVIAAFLYIDPSRSPYYLETDRPRGAFPIKKLFGPDRFRLRLGDLRFAVPPTTFSQVNESMLSPLLDRVRALLEHGAGERLLDLFCGYGLFSLALRPRYREIIAVDASAAALRAARAMVQADNGRARVTFKLLAISRGNLGAALPPPPPPGKEDMILDPPRRGTDATVIRDLARRHPGRVLHLFCASEEIPAALAHWRRSGYLNRHVQPLDMFAGTPQLETLVLLQRS